MRNQRKHYTGEEKVAVLRRHLLEKWRSPSSVTNWGCSRRCSTVGKKNSSRTGPPPSRQGRTDQQAEKERIEFLEKKIQPKDEVLAELMGEHVALKKESWGTLTGVWVPHDVRDQVVDFVRRWSEDTEIGAGRFVGWLGVRAASSTIGENATAASTSTTVGFPGTFGWRSGRSRRSSIFIEEPAGGLSAADVHDAGRRYRGGESVERLAGTGASRVAIEMERKAVAERDRVRATTAAASALAYRCFLHQHERHVLLPVQRFGRLQPFHRALGSARVHDRGRDRDHSATSQGEISGSEAAHHFRQRSAIHRAGFQRVHSHRGHDARANVALLSAIEREVGALAQIVKERVHPAGHAVDTGGCEAVDSTVRGSLQHRAPAQRDRLLRRPTCWPADRRRSTRHAIANWKRHVSSGKRRRQNGVRI